MDGNSSSGERNETFDGQRRAHTPEEAPHAEAAQVLEGATDE